MRQKYYDGRDSLAEFSETPLEVVRCMLELADPKEGEVLYDVGVGDGDIVILAASLYPKIKIVGIEINSYRAENLSEKIRSLGLKGRVKIIQANALEVDVHEADIVTTYLSLQGNERLRPKLERELRPYARVVSHEFVYNGWDPSAVVKVEMSIPDPRPHRVYLYKMSEIKRFSQI